jgi:hypothetical protein
MLVVDGHAASVGEVKGDVAVVQKIVGKKIFYHLLLVAAADDEVVMPEMGIPLHDMPQYGHPSYFDHGFGLELAFFADARAVASCQYHNFHLCLLYLLSTNSFMVLTIYPSFSSVMPG